MSRLGAVAAFCIAVTIAPAHAEDRTIVVYFTEWSAQIDDPATGVIQQAAELSRHGGDGLVTVTGFADTTGSTEAAKLLSATRAQVVVDALVRDGVPSSRIQKAANGATDFVQSPTESHRVTIGIPLL